MKTHVAALCLALPLALLACRSEPKLPSTDAALASAVSLELKNPSAPEPGVLCTGQPSEAQLRELAAQGYKTFVNLRPTTEQGTGWEPAVVGELGLTYANLAIGGAPDVTEANARALTKILDTCERPVLVYCASSNRVGALYGLGEFYEGRASAERALELAKSAGMTRLEPRVRELLALPAAE
ncbi:MAG: hypothetical protein H6828_12650 [Planctomycetes bacterium]|nr:hypothetical protein [Planctomycetota bacterium]